MGYIFVGLGNPGDEYKNSRHNTGRMVLEYLHNAGDFSEWKHNVKLNALVSKGKIRSKVVTLIEPETMMNKSGYSLSGLVTNAKSAENIVVLYDDIDLPLGRVKISFGRGSGGHKGLASIIKKIKTKDFVRFRIGISLPLKRGGVKKPKGESGVIDFILGDFSKKEKAQINKIAKQVSEVAEALVTKGLNNARNSFN
ncbi:aminoacyl-tRNA hydrolase [Patescibacteria group bacterium]|nr:aminoacyl-tRNA hydrolase [Patescibacteria group bacterium]MCH8889352.1 aminoacyl-tRNA hydrolase [Patescibacteria group bacterium]